MATLVTILCGRDCGSDCHAATAINIAMNRYAHECTTNEPRKWAARKLSSSCLSAKHALPSWILIDDECACADTSPSVDLGAPRRSPRRSTSECGRCPEAWPGDEAAGALAPGTSASASPMRNSSLCRRLKAMPRTVPRTTPPMGIIAPRTLPCFVIAGSYVAKWMLNTSMRKAACSQLKA